MKRCVLLLSVLPVIFAASIIEKVEAPYQANLVIASLLNDDAENCSGSIIHRRWILTAAHCLVSLVYPRYLTVTVGTRKFSGDGGKLYEVETHITHENWNLNPTNDIALVRLRKDIVFDDNTQVIRLSRNDADSQENTVARLTSWGRLEDDMPAPVLGSTNLLVISQDQCRQKLSDVIEKLNNTEDRQFFGKAVDGLDQLLCTVPHSNGRRLCHGDSGGPLVINDTQIGIVSSSYRCSGQPGLFTRVSSFIDWIQHHLTKYNDQLS
ncbi:serine protease 100 precursor [Nasonia vitripennis]|uniref:Peptidase S1 domain-containing protein n=1 Tax=Nasonia vitripennis TaxID=7425 RepID=A0A7M6UVY2_NASVI|nr:serine protease 100 precursor [Nasonia vitripennis]